MTSSEPSALTLAQIPSHLKPTWELCQHFPYPCALWSTPKFCFCCNEAWQKTFTSSTDESSCDRNPVPHLPSSVWQAIAPQLETVYLTHQTSYTENHQFLRQQPPQLLYLTFTHSPIFDSTGNISGILTLTTDTTQATLNQYRYQSLQHLSATVQHQSSSRYIDLSGEITVWTCQSIIQAIALNPAEINSARLYLLNANQTTAQLIGYWSPEATVPDPFDSIPLSSDTDCWQLGTVIDSQQPYQLNEPPTIIFPLRYQGILVLGVNHLTPEASQYYQAIANLATLTLENSIYSQTLTSDYYFRHLIESNLFGVAIGNAQGQFVYANDALLDLIGYRREELILSDITWMKLTPPEYHVLDWQAAEELKQTGISTPFQKEYLHKDGHRIPIILGGAALAHPDPQQQHIICFYLDLTPLKQVEQALKLSRERLDLVLKAARLGLWYWDLPINQFYWNDLCREHFGVPLDAEITLETFYQHLHPDDREKTRKAIADAIEHRQPYDIDYRTIAANGKIRWIRAIGQCFDDHTGTPKRFDGITIDITERKQAAQEREQLLQRAEINILRLSQLQELTMTLAQALTLEQVREVLLNQGLCALNAQRGVVVQLTQDRQFLEIVGTRGYHSEQIANFQQIPLNVSMPISDTIRTGELIVLRSPQECNQHYPQLRQTFTDFNTQAIAAVPLQLEDGAIGALGLSFAEPRYFDDADLTFLRTLGQQCAQAWERARLYEGERFAREQAETANRFKDEFLGVLSHELRSPLNPILGWAQLLQSRQFDEPTHKQGLQIIERNVKLQMQLIDDLLDISRILQGKLKLNIAPVNLQLPLTAALATVNLAAQAKDISITTEFQASEAIVVGDSGRLQQIFWNLLSNAIKFTPTGGNVNVILQIFSAHSRAYVQVQVQDTGIGIKQEFLPHVFEYFRQADGRTTRQFGGLGLGLAIVRYLVELHGGTVIVESPGEKQGAIFTVQFPMMLPEKGTPDCL